MFSSVWRTGAIIIGCFLFVGTISAIAAGFRDSKDDLMERSFYLRSESERIHEEGRLAHCDAMKLMQRSCERHGGYDCEEYDNVVNSYERSYGEGARTQCENPDTEPSVAQKGGADLDPQLFGDE